MILAICEQQPTVLLPHNELEYQETAHDSFEFGKYLIKER